MRNKILALLIVCFSLLTTKAQFNTYNFNPAALGIELSGKPATWKTYVNNDDAAGTAAITLADKNAVYYFLVNGRFNVTSWFTVSKDSVVDNYYGSKFIMLEQKAENGKFYTFFRVANSSTIVKEEIDFSAKTASQSTLIDYANSEDFITAYTQAGQVYFLTFEKRRNKLQLYSDADVKGKEIQLENVEGLGDFNIGDALQNIKVIKQGTEYNLYSTKEAAKLYVGKNKGLMLTFDGNYRFTLLYIINLNNFTATSKIIGKNFFYCNGVENDELVQSNSFLYDKYLLSVIFCPNNLAITVKDILTDSVINEFRANRDSDITFAGSDLIKREENTKSTVSFLGPGKGGVTTATVKNTTLLAKDFFKAVNRSQLAITAIPMGDELVLKVGEAHDLTAKGSGFGAGTALYGAGFGLGGAMLSVGLGFGGRYNQTRTGETYFKSRLNANSFTYINRPAEQTLFDKIDSVKEPLKDSLASTLIFDFNGHAWFLYWPKDKKDATIQLVQ